MTERIARLETAIQSRAARRKLTVDPTKIKYSNEELLKLIPPGNRKRILVIGVGHGHDTLSALLDGKYETAVGVDPFIETDGNGTQDYEELLSLIEALDLKDRFMIERTTAQEYFANHDEKFDAILTIDVLHHIFVTPERLSKSAMKTEAAAFFGSIRNALNPKGIFIIKDVERSGLRPFLHSVGILKGGVDFSTKQNWAEWTEVAVQGGLRLHRRSVYVPYGLRNLKPILNNRIGLKSLCKAYHLVFKAAS